LDYYIGVCIYIDAFLYVNAKTIVLHLCTSDWLELPDLWRDQILYNYYYYELSHPVKQAIH